MYNGSMKYRINKVPRKNDLAYYIATSVRNGKNVSTKNVQSLGKRSELEAKGIDIEGYLQGKLAEFNLEETEPVILRFDPKRRVKKGDNGYLNAGTVFVRRLFDDVGLGEVCDAIQRKRSFKYPLSDIAEFLISYRMIAPDSKIGMFQDALKHSIAPVSFRKDDIYRGMDMLAEGRAEILKACFSSTPKGIVRDRKILYYDCTNTYFESEFEDGLRAKGHGKRNEKEPLVSLGLVLDGSGFPLTYSVFKGSTNEQKTLIPLEKEIADEFRNAKFVMITDAGLSSKGNRCFNSLSDRKYITTLPVRKMGKDKLRDYVFDEKKPWESRDPLYNSPAGIIAAYERLSERLESLGEGGDGAERKKAADEIDRLLGLTIYRRYEVLADKKPKEYRRKGKRAKGEEDPSDYIEEDYLVSFSLSYALRERRQRDKLIEKATKMSAKPKKSARGSGDPRQYIKEAHFVASTGEEAKKMVCSIDEDLAREQSLLDGYYCVCTNLKDDDNETIIEAMRYRWFIEDSFRIMKQEFSFRPVGHSADRRIRCHFFTCFLTLLFYRYIQYICHHSSYEVLKGITDEALIGALRDYRLSVVKKDFMFFAGDVDDTVEGLESLFNVCFTKEIMTPSYIKKEIRKPFLSK